MSLEEYKNTHKQCKLCDKLVPKKVTKLDINLENEHKITDEKIRKAFVIDYFGPVI